MADTFKGKNYQFVDENGSAVRPVYNSTTGFLINTSGATASIYEVKGRENISVTSLVAVSLTPPADTTGAIVQVQGANIRFHIDGTTPTSTSGLRGRSFALIQLGTTDGDDQFSFNEVTNFSAIAENNNATLEVTYYGVA